jgi:hypothetical protein
MRSTLLLTATLLLAPLALACSSKDEAKSDDKAKSNDKAKADDKPSLMLTNDTPACRSALSCCEEMVKLEKGEAKPEDINLSCSGVGMAPDDATCDQFKKGYAMGIEASTKPVPDVCK